MVPACLRARSAYGIAMTKTKTMLLDDAPLGQPLYAHLESIVDYLPSTGNRLAHNFRWEATETDIFATWHSRLTSTDLKEISYSRLRSFSVRQEILFCAKRRDAS